MWFYLIGDTEWEHFDRIGTDGKAGYLFYASLEPASHLINIENGIPKEYKGFVDEMQVDF